ncbi:MAG: hypothetical protein J6X94_01195 [Lachnospiraceae bacterium]|nr:hypothetical protein [Lachnospiraceae bacterium]
MKITFEGQDNSTAIKYINNVPSGKQKSAETSFSPESMSALVDIGTAQLPQGEGGKHTLLAGLKKDAAASEAGVLSDARIVMAHTMSGRDLRKANEDGFDLKSMNSEESVTILDKVKAETAKGGTVIKGYNDDLSGSVLESMGNAGLEGIIKNALMSEDLPVTGENIKDVKNTVSLASELESPKESEAVYMIENELMPTVRDFYVAKSAAPASVQVKASSEALDSPEMKNVKESMQEAARVLDDPEEGYERAKWLFEHSLPVTSENILRSKTIDEIEFPVSAEKAAKAAARAIAEGYKAEDADLSGKPGLYEQAGAVLDKYFSEDMERPGDITWQRKIQEIRLSMTAEVNIELIRSGFAIDTAPIEELLNELKVAEQAVAIKYFPETAGASAHGDNAPGMSIGSPEDAVKAYRLMNAVNNSVSELADAPASSLGMFTARIPAEVAFGEFEEIALGEKERIHRAGESYEALMTQVRPDLGDRISKAFANVDSLISEMGLDLNDENRRHVRILAYNRMEISVENIDKVAEADKVVQDVIGKMKPAAVLDMIRNGINPLEKTFDEINKFLDERVVKTAGYEKASENYAQFLYSLDKNKEITAAERESYIGIYRMLNKIESKDGSAVGAVLETGSVLDFSSLLTAVRSSRFKGMDVKIDENTGLAEIRTVGKSITDQIMSSFAENSAEYYEEEAEEIRRSAFAGRESLELLREADLPETPENINASVNLLSGDDDFYKALSGVKKKQLKDDERLSKLEEKAWDILSGADDEADVYRDLMESVRDLASEMTFDAGSVIDVKAMQMVNKQISVAVKMADEGIEEYFVPVEIGGELAKVRVSFKGSGDGSSNADITFKTPDGAQCIAHIEVSGRSVGGYISVNSDDDIKKMSLVSDIFIADLKSQGFDTSSGIGVVRTNQPAGTDAGIYRQEGAGRKELFGISRDFLKAVKESYNEN